MSQFTEWAIILAVKCGVLIFVVVTAFAYLMLVERKMLGWFQLRLGPTWCGPWGLLQPAADAIKLVLKEDETQARAKIEQAFETAGLAVPAVAEVLSKSGVETARARSLLQILLREKRLVRINEDLVFHCAAIERLRGLLAAQ